MGQCEFICDLRDCIARQVYFAGCYEPLETQLVQQLLGPAMTFVDVGAHWGFFTLMAARRTGTRGKVISLEPDPRLCALLRGNVDRNGLTQVTPLPVAASDRSQTLQLVPFDEQGGNWGLSRIGSESEPATLQVPGRRIDDVLDEWSIGDVDMIKIDVEGAEDLALAGMADGLDRARYRAVLLEVHPVLLAKRGINSSNVFRFLAGKRYRAWRLDHSPRASRRAAYRRRLRLRDYLLPFDETAEWDAWPHLLWLAPGAAWPGLSS